MKNQRTKPNMTQKLRFIWAKTSVLQNATLSFLEILHNSVVDLLAQLIPKQTHEL